MMQASKNAFDLIKKSESYSPTPYLCPARQWTIGWGHVILRGEKFTSITLEQGEELLHKDVKLTEICINRFVKVPLSQNQFDALVSFIFNVGRRKFIGSTMLRELNYAQ